jgi:hypothetical protein
VFLLLWESRKHQGFAYSQGRFKSRRIERPKVANLGDVHGDDFFPQKWSEFEDFEALKTSTIPASWRELRIGTWEMSKITVRIHQNCDQRGYLDGLIAKEDHINHAEEDSLEIMIVNGTISTLIICWWIDCEKFTLLESLNHEFFEDSESSKTQWNLCLKGSSWNETCVSMKPVSQRK